MSDPHRLVPQKPASALVFAVPSGGSSRRKAAPIAANEVHVHAFELAADESALRACWRRLSPQERARAASFVRDGDRRNYIVAHGMLRDVLGAYCNVAPDGLHLESAAGRKPVLVTPTVPVSFALSHAGGRALIAVTLGQAVGIDLEVERADVDATAIARMHFAAEERSCIERVPATRRPAVFYDYWVAKEAVLKADGIGLELPLDAFTVRFDRGRSTARVRSHDSRLSSRWRVFMLSLPVQWHGAVAVSDPGVVLRVLTPDR